eukprot:TRINITY_DN1059_c0_g1_i2.p1 TRINITY_DN1059_c0_g1~~TRINITY_DN1059_c0_g1_i2.p1  ORF type:complete len:103 (-),score=1.28 TRINITY_DN1059_c0_g1_i2:259-567(-)
MKSSPDNVTNRVLVDLDNLCGDPRSLLGWGLTGSPPGFVAEDEHQIGGNTKETKADKMVVDSGMSARTSSKSQRIRLLSFPDSKRLGYVGHLGRVRSVPGRS